MAPSRPPLIELDNDNDSEDSPRKDLFSDVRPRAALPLDLSGLFSRRSHRALSKYRSDT
jgi:hypothetical protein